MARGGNQNVNNDSRQVVGSSNMSLMEDFGSPFYMQNGDHPCLVLVSHHLTGSNYNIWSCSMFMALTMKNKVGLIDGSTTWPTYDNLLFVVWTRCNSMVISWILNVVFREITYSLLYIDNAFKTWILIFVIILTKAMVLKFSKSRSSLLPLTKDLLMSMAISPNWKLFGMNSKNINLCMFAIVEE